MSESDKSIYSKTWDEYVTHSFPRIKNDPPNTGDDLLPWQVLNTTAAEYAWPGDEWGDRDAVQAVLEKCIFGRLETAPAQLCELGCGAGRMTAGVLERYPGARIDCFDVSREFLDQLTTRFAGSSQDGLIRAHLLTSDPRFMYHTLRDLDLVGRVDCVFSFDAMVHVELHSVLIYVATAAQVLRPGGLLTMNVADATTDNGFSKLLFNAPGGFARGGAAGSHFQFVSPDIIGTLLERLGFAYELLDCNGRDLFFAAKLQDQEAAPAAFAAAGSKWKLEP